MRKIPEAIRLSTDELAEILIEREVEAGARPDEPARELPRKEIAKVRQTKTNTPIAAAIFSIASILSSAALADAELPELVQTWGLVGKWATDCSPEATPQTVIAYEIEPDGRIIVDNGASLTE